MVGKRERVSVRESARERERERERETERERVGGWGGFTLVLKSSEAEKPVLCTRTENQTQMCVPSLPPQRRQVQKHPSKRIQVHEHATVSTETATFVIVWRFPGNQA